MERKTLWKNFLLLAIGGLFALHMNVSMAADSVKGTPSTTTSISSEDCVLEAE